MFAPAGQQCVKLAGYSSLEKDDTQLIVCGNDKSDISDDVCKLAFALKDMTRNQIKDFFSLPQTQDCFCLTTRNYRLKVSSNFRIVWEVLNCNPIFLMGYSLMSFARERGSDLLTKSG